MLAKGREDVWANFAEYANSIRSVCFLGHVDHGKTTLCDHLIATNGYLSKRSAGTARFMDAREDEQQRLITMKSSSIALLYAEADANKSWLINVIDSPGHVDFSSEVCAAVRLSDCAFIVIDVLEGFLAQTRNVLNQALGEGVALVLILNQFDKLILESQLSASEIYDHIRGLIENVNVAFHQIIHAMIMSKWPNASDEEVATESDRIFQDRLFSPERSNVVFSSALHGWAFTMSDVADCFFEKLFHRSCNESERMEFLNSLWGDFSWNPKSKSVQRMGPDSRQQNLASSLVLRTLCEIYSLENEFDSSPAKLKNILSFTGVTLEPGSKVHIGRAILAEWLPCARGVIRVAIRIPDPRKNLDERFRYVLESTPSSEVVNSATVLHVAKFMGADISVLRMTADRLHGGERLRDLVAFGKIFLGTLKAGQVLHIANSTHPDSEPVPDVVVERLFVPLGLDLMPVDVAPAGAVVAVQIQTVATVAEQVGADASSSDSILTKTIDDTCKWLLSLKHSAVREVESIGSATRPNVQPGGFNPVDRAVTFVSTMEFPSFLPLYSKMSSPIIRVLAVPKNLTDWPEFIRGLALLYRADPAVKIDVNETGEFVICCCGEVHLEKTIGDLNNLYCGCPLEISEPLPALRETIVPLDSQTGPPNISKPFPPWARKVSSASLAVEPVVAETQTSDGSIQVGVEAFSLDAEAVDWMTKSVGELYNAFHYDRVSPRLLMAFDGTTSGDRLDDISACKKVAELAIRSRSKLREIKQSLFLSVCVMAESRTALFATPEACKVLYDSYDEISSSSHTCLLKPTPYLPAIVSGFRMGSMSGPICGEPVRGVAFLLRFMSLTNSSAPELSPSGEHISTNNLSGSERCSTSAPPKSSTFGPLGGQLIRAMKVCCQNSLLQRGRLRVFEVVLQIELYCEQDSLGQVYSVLYQRRVKITNEKPVEGTTLFLIGGTIPSTQVMGIASDIRRKSSGKCSIQIAGGEWVLNTEDPFPEACLSEVELQDGEDALVFHNTPRSLILQIRKRKGLPTEVKTVESAEKQRTLGRNK